VVVSRYGPLEPIDASFAAFTVVHGPNEKGKTLLIDALLRMLFKDELKRTHVKLFGNLGRVSEAPEGFVVIATHAEETKLAPDAALSSVAPGPITPEDFRNVFLIRDSDLDLHEETAYYGRVTEQLCGTRSRHIEKIMAALKTMGRLRSATPDSVLTRSKITQRVGERLEAAEELLDEMNAARLRLEAAGFDAADRRLVDRIERRAQLESERERFRVAERRARLVDARSIVAAARARANALAALAGIDESDLASWRRIVAERGVLKGDVERLEGNRAGLGERVEEARAALERTRAAAGEVERRRNAARAEIVPALEKWLRDRDARERADRAAPARLGAMIAAAVLGAAAAVAAFVTREPFLAGAAAACAAVAGGFGVLIGRAARERTALAGRERELAAVAARLGLPVASVETLPGAIASLTTDVEHEQDRGRDAEAALRAIEGEVSAREEELARRRARLQELAVEETTIRGECGCPAIDALEAKIGEKRRLEADLDAKLVALRATLPAVTAREPAQALDGFAREIERRLAEIADAGVPDDPEASAATDRELARVVEEERALRRALEQGRHELKHVEFKLSELGILDESVRCRTSRELAMLGERVREFCETVRRDQRLAQEAIRIFQEIDAEEREKVGELFGAGSMVSKWFHEITDGRYRAVHFDAESGEVEVERADGKRLPATSLSGGAFDQLYLAVRSSIAERMFPASKGFFILDDPFLKADRERLRTLMKMLRRLVERGWQVIYFTAKDEVVDALDADIRDGNVRVLELERPLFARPLPKPAPPTDRPRLF
jgi:DNA repair exonuclease SbcCD ATPase subunit